MERFRPETMFVYVGGWAFYLSERGMGKESLLVSVRLARYNFSGGRVMPLRDHFHPPVTKFDSWEELHGAWPATIAYRLNALLPAEYRSGVKVHLGNLVEVDVGPFEMENAGEPETGAASAWQASAPTLLLETEELTPPEYEVRVYDQEGKQKGRI
jgi:hypothetical protein